MNPTESAILRDMTCAFRLLHGLPAVHPGQRPGKQISGLLVR